MRRVGRWAYSHPKSAASLFLLTCFLVLNVLAYRHAHAMTHFVSGGGSPEPVANLSFVSKVGLALNGLSLGRPHRDARPDQLGLPYEVHTFAGDAGKLEGWYLPRADNRGLVLLFHGYSACKAQLLPEARAFHDLGFACFLVDFRGSGGSDGSETTIGYYEADDVARAAAYARRHWPGERLILYGQSMGSAAILRALAGHEVRADALVLECPFDRLLTTIEARFDVVKCPTFPAAQLLLFWGGLQHGFNAFAHNPVEYARGVNCPVLLLHGKDDSRVTCAQMESIFRSLRGTKQLHFFGGLGHESYVAKRATEWKQCVSGFLQTRGKVELAGLRPH